MFERNPVGRAFSSGMEQECGFAVTATTTFAGCAERELLSRSFIDCNRLENESAAALPEVVWLNAGMPKNSASDTALLMDQSLPDFGTGEKGGLGPCDPDLRFLKKRG
jgi:hypothetical protein